MENEINSVQILPLIVYGHIFFVRNAEVIGTDSKRESRESLLSANFDDGYEGASIMS